MHANIMVDVFHNFPPLLPENSEPIQGTSNKSTNFYKFSQASPITPIDKILQLSVSHAFKEILTNDFYDVR